jgi:hypothetical protein
MEISQANISEAPVETKTKLANDLMRLLQVREKNSEMAKDWILYLATTPKFFKLTPGEVYEAFKMAMSRDLLDSKDNEFNLLPELSINTTSRVLDAYIQWKRRNDAYQKAKSELKLLDAPSGMSDEEKANTREKFLLDIYNDMMRGVVHSSAWILFDEVKDKITTTDLVKKRLYRIQEKKYLKEYRSEVKSKGNKQHHIDLLESLMAKSSRGKFIGVVQNRCKSIAVFNYLKKFKDYTEFKNQINGTEQSTSTK